MIGWKMFSIVLALTLDPVTQNKALIATNKQMQMIRHNHIATYSDVEGLLGTLGKKNERSMDLILCQEPLSFVRAERDEIKRTCCEDAL